MSSYLIAGAPGSGKTTVGEMFKSAGYHTIDTDNYPELTNWVNKSSQQKVTPPKEGMSKEWLQDHDYLWDMELVHKLINSAKEKKLIFYGSSSNQDKYLGLFDKVFLLEIDPENLIQRLQTRKGNKYGKVQSEIDHVLTWYLTFQEDYKSRGVIVVDASQPVQKVFESVRAKID